VELVPVDPVLDELAEPHGGAAADGSFDLHGFALDTFERCPTRDIEWLVEHGIDGHEFHGRELACNWRALTREQRAAKIAAFVRFANLLEERPQETGEASDRLEELRATVRTKIVLLSTAYDISYADRYRRRIARSPGSFGAYELPQTLA
ncbi:MAG: hypothetical protein QOJ07_3604, partial [Thermoleophilaceae bacterium]|nr:hypothetical protein [Thermoleophilaceae bacterium]